jgi:cold shock protein
MKKIKVQFVKYDMTKTKNRKRREMLVDSQTEQAVINQLERIHKGEKVVKIYEIIWDEEQIEELVKLQKKEIINRMYGVVKFYNQEKGFGFIQPDEEMEDLFFHKTACPEGVPDEGSTVEFQMSEGPKGLCAIQVRAVEE